MPTLEESRARALDLRRSGRPLAVAALIGVSLVLLLLAAPFASVHLLPSAFAGPSSGSTSGRPSHGAGPPGHSPLPGGGGPAPTGSGSTGSPSGAIILVGADWTLTGPGTGYLGPSNQSLCSNCPLTTTVNGNFAITFSLTNRGPSSLSVFVGSAYVGCDPPFYVEQVAPAEPSVITAGQTVTITVYVWADKATPGSWTFLGRIGT